MVKFFLKFFHLKKNQGLKIALKLKNSIEAEK